MRNSAIAVVVLLALFSSGCAREGGKGNPHPTPSPTSGIASPYSTTLPMNLGLVDNDPDAMKVPTQTIWVALPVQEEKICPGGQSLKEPFTGHMSGGTQANQPVYVTLCRGVGFPKGIHKPHPSSANDSTTLPMNLGLLENATSDATAGPATSVLWVRIETNGTKPVCTGGSIVSGPTKDPFDGHLAGAPGTTYKKVSVAICQGTGYPSGTASPNPDLK